MLERILVPVDGSKRSQAVFGQLGWLFRLPGTEVLVVRAAYVHPSLRGVDPTAHLAEGRAEAQDHVRELVHALLKSGVRARGIVPTGFPSGSILDTATAERATLIAMTSHGSSGYPRWSLGSVTEKILDGSRIPVLLVRSFRLGDGDTLVPAGEDEIRFRRILVPTDGSEASLSILPAARELAQASGADLILLHVTEDESLPQKPRDLADTVRERLQGMGAQATAMTTRGDPASQIVDAGRAQGADLIAMATQGGPEGWVGAMGSVTRRVLHEAHTTMLVVQSGKARPSEPSVRKESMNHPIPITVP